MKTSISAIALAMMAASTQVQAFDFGVNAANLEKANTSKWACKKCNTNIGTQGEFTLAAGSAVTDGDHASNALGYEDGFAAGVDADILHIGDSGTRSEIQAKELGSERGDLRLSHRMPGRWQVEAELDTKSHVDTTTAQTDPSDLDKTEQLKLEREKLGFAARYMGGRWGARVAFDNEELSGKQASSVSLLGNTTNIAKPVDSVTRNMVAAVHATGDRWLLEAGYQGSWYDNDILGFAVQAPESALAGAPDNQAQQVFLKGRYQVGSTRISGRVATGEQKQDADLVTLTGVPAGVEAADLKVDTLDAELGLTSRLSSNLTLRAAARYRDRDNDSTLYEFEQIRFGELSGQVEQTQAMDTTKANYRLSADYRLAMGQKLSAGIEYENIERSASEREETDETEVWVSYRLSSLELWDLRLKASYGQRDGSRFEADSVTSSEENDLMRKYHLADRNRTQVVAEIGHTPLPQLSIDLRIHYALDDYDDSEIGLTESEDYGYDLSLGWEPGDAWYLSLFGGYQWIDNEQLGSDNGDYATWSALSSDEFGFAGVSADYLGLKAWGVKLSASYQYALSISDAHTSAPEYLGEYESTSHSVQLRAEYALSDRSAIGLRYQYERYQDSDYADIPVVNYPGQGVWGLTSLGDLSQDYNAHLVMATFSYKL